MHSSAIPLNEVVYDLGFRDYEYLKKRNFWKDEPDKARNTIITELSLRCKDHVKNLKKLKDVELESAVYCAVLLEINGIKKRSYLKQHVKCRDLRNTLIVELNKKFQNKSISLLQGMNSNTLVRMFGHGVTPINHQEAMQDIKVLQELSKCGNISLENKYNAIYPYRSVDEQKDYKGHGYNSNIPSNAIKFAVTTNENKVFNDESFVIVYHGVINPNNLQSIFQTGLKNRQSGSHLGVFVSPSYWTDLFTYGTLIESQCGKYVNTIVIQCRANKNCVKKKFSNTAYHEMITRDVNMSKCGNEIEWLMDEKHVVITGIIVKRLLKAHWKTHQALNMPFRKFHK